MTTADLIDDLRSRINPLYAWQLGTESYERRLCVEALEAQAAEVEALRGAVLWVLWHHQGGSSPVGQPIRRALGIGAHDRLSDGQVQAAMQWAMQWADAARAKEKE